MKIKFAFPICTILVLTICSLSAFSQEEEKDMNGYLLWEDHVNPADFDTYEKAVKMQMELMKEANAPFPINTYQTSDYIFYYVTPIKNFAGIDKLFDSFSELYKANEEAMNSIDEAYEGTYAYTLPRIFFWNEDLSYKPEEPMEGLKDAKFFYMGQCYVKQGKGKEMGEVFKKFVELYKENNIPRGFSTYYGSFGFETPFMFWTTYDKNAADFWMNGKKINEKLGDNADNLWIEAEKFMRKFEYKTGWYRDDLSYQPEE